MVKFVEWLKKWLGIWIGIFVFVVIWVILVKWDRSSTDPLKVEEGTTAALTTEKWNQMIDKINNLETQLSNVSTAWVSWWSWVWSWIKSVTAGVEYTAEKDLFINHSWSCSSNTVLQYTYWYIINPTSNIETITSQFRCQNWYNHTNSHSSFIVPKWWKYKFNYSISINVWELN